VHVTILSDLHASNNLPYSRAGTDGISDRLKDVARFLLRLSKSKPEGVIVLGDLFDRRRLDAVTIKVVTRAIKHLARNAGFVWLLPGNHDTEDAAGNHNTLQYLEALEDDKITILKHGQTVEVEGVVFHAFPYLPPKGFIESVKEGISKLDDDYENVALVHQYVKGVKQAGMEFPTDVPPEIFNPFDLVLAGHAHHKQRIGRVQFVGSTYNLDFREANQVQGFHRFDTETLELDFVESKMPRFRTFEGEPGHFGKDDYVIVFDPEEEPHGRARLLTTKRTEEIESRGRLELDAERFTLEEAIAQYVDLKAPEESDKTKLVELGCRLIGDTSSRAGSIPGLVTFKSVEASNFLCFERMHPVDLERPGVTLVIGRNLDTTAAVSNGAGKSTFFRAIVWALYGEVIEGKIDVRTRGARGVAEVKLTFEKSGDEYEIVRRRGKSKGELSLSMNGEDVSAEGSQKDTQAKIVRLLGLDFLSFRNSVLFGQGDRMRFADPEMKDEERKRIFRSALDIDDTIKAGQKAASEFKSRKAADLSVENGKIENTRSWILKLKEQASEFEEASNAFEEERAAKIRSLEVELDELPDVAGAEAKLRKLKKRKADAYKECAGEEKAIASRDKLKKRLEELASDKSEIESSTAKLETMIGIDEVAIAKFDEGRCPTCGTPADSDHIRAHLKDVSARISRSKSTARENGARIDGIGEQVSKVKAAIERLDGQILASRDARLRAETFSGSIRALEAKLSHVEDTRERLKADIREAKGWRNAHTEAIEKTKENLESSREDLKKSKGRAAKLSRAVELLNFWVAGFGNRGLASFLVELYLPKLEAYANRYLSILTDGDIEIRLSATRTTKRGSESEQIAVTFDVEGIEDATPSGGQRKKIEIATDLAFMDILSERDGAEIGLVILDEILDGLDAEGRARVVTLIDELRRRKGAAFVISHDAELSAVFDNVLIAVRKGNRTTIAEA